MRSANVYMHGMLAGILSEDEEGYSFEYAGEYLESQSPKAVSLTLPIQKEAFQDKYLFPFFDGLIPEGWLLDIVEKNWKLDPRDRMGLLLSVCHDCIGAVHVEPIE